MDTETLLRYEPHAHTAEVSRCAKMPAAQMVHEVKKAGYDAVVVTDHYDPDFFVGAEEGESYRARLHDFFAGYRAAKEAGDKEGLLVLPALEMRNIHGMEDYLIYGITEEQLSDLGRCLSYMTLEESLAFVRRSHGLLFQAHPFRGYLNCMPASLMDGVEVLNANPRHDSQNHRALAFGQENGLYYTAGSDVHQLGDAGSAGVLAPRADTIEEYCENLRNKRHTCFVRENGQDRLIEG